MIEYYLLLLLQMKILPMHPNKLVTHPLLQLTPPCTIWAQLQVTKGYSLVVVNVESRFISKHLVVSKWLLTPNVNYVGLSHLSPFNIVSWTTSKSNFLRECPRTHFWLNWKNFWANLFHLKPTSAMIQTHLMPPLTMTLLTTFVSTIAWPTNKEEELPLWTPTIEHLMWFHYLRHVDERLCVQIQRTLLAQSWWPKELLENTYIPNLPNFMLI